MTMVTTANVMQVGLTCVPILFAANQTLLRAQRDAEGGMTMRQYCAPPDENTELQRLYFRCDAG
jgi:hypothetical protein